MTQLIERWLESFSKWPSLHQMGFSAVLVLAGLVLVVIVSYLFYLALYYAAILARGWPDDTGRPTWKDMAYLNKSMEAYRQWEKQQKQLKPPQPAASASSTPPAAG